MEPEKLQRGTKKLSNTKWQHQLESRKKDFKLFKANTEVAEFTKLVDGTKRLIRIKSELNEFIPIQDYFSISSGCEVSIPKIVEEVLIPYKTKHPSSYITFEIVDSIENKNCVDLYEETDTLRNVLVRTKQAEFRTKLLAKHKKCQLTNLDIESLLIASNIKPWSMSNDEERMDINNGLLLSQNIDALFDKGYISFKDDGSLIRSFDCTDEIISIFNIPINAKIKLESGHLKYIDFHRNTIFRKEK